MAALSRESAGFGHVLPHFLTAVAAPSAFLTRIRDAVCFPKKYGLKCLAVGAAGVTAVAAAAGMVNGLERKGNKKPWMCQRPVRVRGGLGGSVGDR